MYVYVCVCINPYIILNQLTDLMKLGINTGTDSPDVCTFLYPTAGELHKNFGHSSFYTFSSACLVKCGDVLQTRLSKCSLNLLAT
jgi:hypothetical protein